MSPERHGAWQTYERVVRLVVPRIIVVVGLSAIAIAASGCLGDSDAEAESPPTTTTGQVDTRPPARPTVDIAKLRAAFKETFGTPPDERPWYGLITGMKMAQRTLEIATKVDSESNPAARTICGAAMRLALDSEAGDGIESVRVMGSDGVALGGCA